MYSTFQLSKKYLQYQLTATNGKGHGIHSPFVFDFVNKVLNDDEDYPVYRVIEEKRKVLLSNSTVIEIEDFGAGSAVIKTNKRRISAIAGSSLKPRKYAQLLYRMVKYFKPGTIVELGTSLGITSAYLAAGNELARLYTCEGAGEIASIAQKNFEDLQLKNIELIKGEFSDTLPRLLPTLNKINFAFVDGNHRKAPTVAYFLQLLSKSEAGTVLVFDDIHWSAEMEGAWAEIKSHPAVTLSIDLFYVGIIFMNPDFKNPQHFTIRF